MGKGSFLFAFLIFFVACNVKENSFKFKDKMLESEILRYINKYNLSKTCDIHVMLIKFKYNYKAFNISTSTSPEYGKPINCLKLNGYNILLYSGWEDYLLFEKELQQVDTSSICIDASPQLTIDSAGVIQTYDNIGLVHQCDLPDVKHLVQMSIQFN